MLLAWFPITSSWNPTCYVQGLIHRIGRLGLPNAILEVKQQSALVVAGWVTQGLEEATRVVRGSSWVPSITTMATRCSSPGGADSAPKEKKKKRQKCSGHRFIRHIYCLVV